MNDKVVEAIEIQNFEEATIEDAKKTMQNIFNDITPKEFEEIKKQAIENDLCMNKSKAQVINLYLDLLDDDIKQKEVLDKIKDKIRYYKQAEYGTYDSDEIISDIDYILIMEEI